MSLETNLNINCPDGKYDCKNVDYNDIKRCKDKLPEEEILISGNQER